MCIRDSILTVSSLLKEKSQDESILGKEIRHKMDNGDLIEDTVVISVLKEKVKIIIFFFFQLIDPYLAIQPSSITLTQLG